MKITLRKANLSDLRLLQYWDQQQHVIDSNPGGGWDWETELNQNCDWCIPYISEMDGQAIGFLQIVDPAGDPSNYWGIRSIGYRAIDIWIGEANNLNIGIGTIMMNIAIARCFEDKKVTSILVDPLFTNTKAQRFYQRLGFKHIETKVLGEDKSCVYRLDRQDWNERSEEIL